MLTFQKVRASYFLIRVAFMVLALCCVGNATGNDVDLTFHATPSKNLTSSAGNLALQPDGKIIIFGNFHLVNGVPRAGFARLNSDGTLDSTLNYSGSDFASVSSVVVQNDGKILVAGTSVNAVPRITRLNSDGSPDLSYTSPWSAGGMTYSATVYAVQPDNKSYAAVHAAGFHIVYTTLYRLNSDGSNDNSFTPISFEGWNAKYYLNSLMLLSGGQVLVGGSHSDGYVFRLNANGSKDTSFESPLLTQSSALLYSVVTSVARQSDGKVLFTGSFTAVNGINRTGLTRLNADGTLDLQFPQTPYNGTIRVLSNDKIILDGNIRLNSDGTLDNTFNPPASLWSVNKWQIDGLDRVVLFGGFTDAGETNYRYARLNADGSLDSSFNPIARLSGIVDRMAMQPDSRTLVSGDFSQMNGIPRSNFARIEPDGTLDSTFDVGTGFDSDTSSIAVQANGKILVGGGFLSYNGVTQPKLVRLAANGNLDSAFVPSVDGTVKSIAVQTDEKILIGGSFTNVNSVLHRALARLNSDGTTDATFNPLFGSGSISSVVVQSNDMIIIGGTFGGVSGVARSNMARLTAAGGVDLSFNAGSVAPVSSIVVQPDGKYLVSIGSTLKRLNVDGSADNTFQSPVLVAGSDPGSIGKFILQTDGSVIIGGNFYTVNGIVRPNLMRLSANGQLDVAFFPGGANGIVNSVVSQPSGKVIIGGSFTSVDNILRPGISRLNTDPFHRAVNFDYDGDGKADVSVYRPSNNVWYLFRSSDSQFSYQSFGAPGDIVAPADFDGDGRTDIAIFRPSSGDWWYKSSISGTFVGMHWGMNGDVPRPSDVDGDGKADYVVYRESTGNWYRLSSASGLWSYKTFGAPGDKPLLGDFDGDGKSDPAIYRPSTGVFWYLSSIDSTQRAIPWGFGTDIPVPADYDGDGKTEAAVFRPSNGVWYIYFSTTNTYASAQFGLSGDKPISADYDGDGKADIAVYRPSNGTWYLLRSTAGFTGQQFGISTDVPTPNAFVP